MRLEIAGGVHQARLFLNLQAAIRPDNPKHAYAREEGSGRCSTSETPSRKTNRGSPSGVPCDRNVSAWLTVLAVKVIVCFAQGWKSWVGLFCKEELKLWVPKVTFHCSVVAPSKLRCCPAA